MGRIILHVDMDAFYAAVEERDDPRLRGHPLVIGAEPGHRGVVCTANYAARTHGIHSAMPIHEAVARCSHANFRRPDFPRYKESSRRVMDVLSGYADVLEVVGMDEAYLDVTDATDWDALPAFCISLRAAVKRATGLSCSIGAAPSKSIAKVASDRHKPHGLTIVLPGTEADFLSPLPVRLVHGCGPKTAKRLAEWGIETAGDLAAQDPDWMGERFGSHGRFLRLVAAGHDDRPVVADRGPRKSRGSERTFQRDERHPAFLHTTARRLLEEILEGSDPCTTVTVKVRYKDFSTLTRTQSFPVPLGGLGAKLAFERAVHDLLGPLLGRPVRLLGVRLSGFSPVGQQGLAPFGVHPVARLPRPDRRPAPRTVQRVLKQNA